jgi:phosphatidylglycerophosphate synthase
MSTPSTTAVILPPRPGSFLVVAGVPLIQRVAISAQRAGYETVIALAGDNEARLRALLSADARSRDIRVVAGSNYAAANGEGVTYLPSDHLLTAATLARVRAFEANGAPVLFQAEGALNGDGILLTVPGTVEGGAPRPVRLDGEVLLPVRDAASAALAERRLIAALPGETAATDGPLARFDRHVSTRVSRLLVRTPLRPNHITAFGTAVGLTAAWAFSRGTYAYGVLGAVLFWCAVIIDGCDGEVARLKFLESRFGYLFDVTTDNIVHIAIFAGLGVGEVDAVSAHWLVPLFIVGFLLASAATYFCLIRNPPTHAASTTARGRFRKRLLGAFEALMNRDFAYLVLALALIGRVRWFLWCAAFGTYVYAAALAVVYTSREAR